MGCLQVQVTYTLTKCAQQEHLSLMGLWPLVPYKQPPEDNLQC